jgi:hypothetical protein
MMICCPLVFISRVNGEAFCICAEAAGMLEAPVGFGTSCAVFRVRLYGPELRAIALPFGWGEGDQVAWLVDVVSVVLVTAPGYWEAMAAAVAQSPT